VLQFDHVRGVKLMAIAQMIPRGYSLVKVRAEIDKCEVRCANCHIRKTAKDFNYYRTVALSGLEPEHSLGLN
jgi:hypothetical protein